MNDFKAFAPPLGKRVNLAHYDPQNNGTLDKDTAKQETDALREQLRNYQERLYAEGRQSLLIVLQAMDAGGKDGTIKSVFEGVNPQGVRVTSFKRPTELELAHDFLWRVHQHTPSKGMIGIFNRSHYEDVLIARVNQLVDEDTIQQRYAHINAFERLLVDNGTQVVKIFLHISKDEQKERFLSRLEEPNKRWKFSKGDLPVRERWDDYMRAFELAIEHCHTEAAPWYIVPANKKWFRNWVVMRILVGTLAQMNPQFPTAEEGLDQIVIPD